jgi:hypothetical protein
MCEKKRPQLETSAAIAGLFGGGLRRDEIHEDQPVYLRKPSFSISVR